MKPRKLTDACVLKAKYEGDGTSRDVRWDTLLPGFGLRVTPAGGKSYVVSYRYRGHKRLLTVGRVALYPSVRDARTRARDMLGGLHDRGVDPQRSRQTLKAGLTVAELWADYDASEIARRPPNSQRSVRSLFRVHILPVIGSVSVAQLDSRDVVRMHDRATLRGRVVANRAVERLADCLAWSKARHEFPPGWTNPCTDVKKHREHARRHSLTAPQLRALWDALDAEDNPFVRAFIRVLILTGARKSEVLALRWADVDLLARRALLRQTKANGAEYLILPSAAVAELAALPRTESAYVFPGERANKGPMSDGRYAYKAALKRAELPAATTMHDLRRSMGVALAHSGYSAEAIAAVLRNTSNVAAKHYIQIAATHVIEATDKAATAILGRP